jgi:ribosomal protein S18 acetylase RimI-like enzyme
LTQFTPDLARIAPGYTSYSRYAITRTTTTDGVVMAARREPLDQPHVKQWEFYADELAHYKQVLEAGYSFGAYDGDLLVGLIITEPRDWNGSLWVWEFHVAPTHQRLGIGRRLMDEVAAKGAAADYRIIVCEAQNTNGDGIDAYRALGFGIEGIDLSYYSNTDYPDGEVAVFMKRPLGAHSPPET